MDKPNGSKMDNREIVDALRQASHEIQYLRRQNEVLGAKVETMELLGRFLHAQVRERSEGATVDIVWTMERLIQRIEDEPHVAAKEAAAAAEGEGDVAHRR
jgi:hypothetical protein